MDLKKLKKVYKTTLKFRWALLADLVFYAAVVETIKRMYFPFEGFMESGLSQPLRWIFIGLGLGQFFIIRKLSILPLTIEVPSGEKERMERLRISTLITFGLSEMVALLGLVLYLLGGLYFDFYILLGICLFYFFIFYPRYSEWETWFKEGAPKIINEGMS